MHEQAEGGGAAHWRSRRPPTRPVPGRRSAARSTDSREPWASAAGRATATHLKKPAGRGSVWRMRDGLLLRALKRAALAAFQVDLAVHRAVRRARGERPWALDGDCQRCAACCEAQAIAMDAAVWSVPPPPATPCGGSAA